MFLIHSSLLIFPWQGNPWAQDLLACVTHQKALRQWFHWSISWTWIAFSSLLLYLLSFVIPVKSLCGLEASCVPTEEVLSVSGESCDSSDEMDTKESINGRAASRKKKSKRHKGGVTCPPGALQAGPAWGMLMLGIYRMVTGLLGHSGICVCIKKCQGFSHL